MDIFNHPNVRVSSNGSWLDAEPRNAPTSRTNSEPVARYTGATSRAVRRQSYKAAERLNTSNQTPWWK